MARGASLPISIRQVTKAYGSVRALDHVDLEIRSGEFLTLLGPSGSGKTTLLMVLAGFTRPDWGSLKFGEAEVIRLAPHKRDIGMVFQSYALFPHMDVAANIGFPLRLRKVAKADAAKRIEQALEMVQLAGLGSRRVEQLSGGQRQRVALARAIVFEPRILLMDEPLSALDKQLREHMQIELRRLHDKLGMTTVYVTHDQREALTMSDRVAVIRGGRIMQLDTPRRLYERPANRFVAEFIGESTFLPVETSNGAFICQGERLKLPGSSTPTGPCLLMLRPERLQILSGAMQDHRQDHLNVLRGIVQNIVYQGDSFLLQARLADGAEIGVRGVSTSGAMAALPKPGEEVRLGLEPEDTILLAQETCSQESRSQETCSDESAVP
ncbi:putative spermidine/putrescine transport system ATP-binding protein [Rhizobiales bacterium GAS113]|nr:putative spermidine/putrescine transport system ATP-binding protein [Rhizobiales bacterium GAS113]